MSHRVTRDRVTSENLRAWLEMKRPSGLKKSAENAKKARLECEAEEATVAFEGDGSDFEDIREMFLQAEEASCTHSNRLNIFLYPI